MLSRFCLLGVSRGLNRGLAALPLGTSQLQILGETVKLLPSFTGEEASRTALSAELAAVAGTSDETRSDGSAGRPLSRSLRHPQYDRQLHTSAMLAQRKALLARSKQDASDHGVQTSVPCPASTSLS